MTQTSTETTETTKTKPDTPPETNDTEPREGVPTQHSPRTGDQWADQLQEQAQATQEMTQEALKPTQEGDYGQDPAPLESNPPLEPVKDVLSDYWERTEKAKDENDGVSGNQDEPSYQPATEILRDPEQGDSGDDSDQPIQQDTTASSSNQPEPSKTTTTDQQPQQSQQQPTQQSTSS